MNIAHLAPLSIGAFSIVTGIALLNSTIAIRADLEGFSSGAVGLMTTAYFVGYMLGVMTLATTVGRTGHIRFYAACAAVLTAAILTHGLSDSFWVWMILRFISGISVLGMYLVFESWLNSLIPHQQRGGVFSLYVTLTLLAFAAGQLALLFGEPKTMKLFVIASILVVASIVPFSLTHLQEPERLEKTGISWLPFWRQAPLGLVSAVASGIVTSVFWGLGPLYFTRSGWDLKAVSFSMFSIIMGAATLQWIIGWLSDRYDRRRIIALVCISSAALAVTLGVVVEKDWIVSSMITGFFYGSGAFSLYGLAVAHINDYVENDKRLAAAEMALAAFGIGACIGPLIAGPLMELTGAVSFPLFCAVVLCATGMYSAYRITRRAPAPELERSTYYPMIRTSPGATSLDPRVTDADPENKQE